jgi:hypothetical protein
VELTRPLVKEPLKEWAAGGGLGEPNVRHMLGCGRRGNGYMQP